MSVQIGARGAAGEEMMGTNRARPAAASGGRAGRGEVPAHRLAEPREPLKLYLHNASTSSPGATCGAIPSRPLRRRSWCALLGLRPGQPRGRLARSGHSRRLPAEPRWGPRSPAPHPRPTGWAGWAGFAARLRVRASSPRVGGRGPKRAVPPRPTPRGRGRRPSRALRPRFRASASPPSAPSRRPLKATGLRGTLPRRRAGASAALRSAP